MLLGLSSLQMIKKIRKDRGAENCEENTGKKMLKKNKLTPDNFVFFCNYACKCKSKKIS